MSSLVGRGVETSMDQLRCAATCCTAFLLVTMTLLPASVQASDEGPSVLPPPSFGKSASGGDDRPYAGPSAPEPTLPLSSPAASTDGAGSQKPSSTLPADAPLQPESAPPPPASGPPAAASRPTATTQQQPHPSVVIEQQPWEIPHEPDRHVLTTPLRWLGPLPWETSIEFGLNGSTGTNESFSLRTGGSVQWESEFSQLNLSGYYNRTTAGGIETQNNAQVDLRNDWLLDPSSPGLCSPREHCSTTSFKRTTCR